MMIMTRRALRTSVAALFVVATLVPAQPSIADTEAARWTKQAPSPTWYNLAAVAAISPTEVWAASAPLLGDVGEIAHTKDGGATWTVSAMPRQVNAVFFHDSLHGWAAGNGIYHSVDGGATWIQDEDFGTIYDVYFLDAKYGWAAGNGAVTYYTTDGGLNWNFVQTGGGSTMKTIFFADRRNGWAADLEGEIFHSTDGGRSWDRLASVDANNLQSLQFFDLDEGWAIGGDDFFRTTNGGRTWTRSAVPAGTWAYGARFADPQHGVAVGEYGNIVRTKNGGASWQTIAPVGSGQRLWDVAYGDADTAFLVGDEGTIERSTDQGASWESIQSGGAGATHGFDATNGKTAWAGQDAGEIAYTVNGGRHWNRATVQGFDVYGFIAGVGFADESRGWAVGGNEFFGGSYGAISRSDDGGKTWQWQYRLEERTLNAIAAIDRQKAVAVGTNNFAGGGGVVLRTTNGGSTWQDVTPDERGFRDVFFANATTGWIVGFEIYQTTDGGAHWTRQWESGGETLLDAVSFADAKNGWATGYGGVVLHTTNGGRTWTPQSADEPAGTAILGVTAINAKTAWIAGSGGFAAKTINGGAAWNRETVTGAGGTDFEDTIFVSAKRGWVGGNIGIWARTGAG